jgi:hypothetical protein
MIELFSLAIFFQTPDEKAFFLFFSVFIFLLKCRPYEDDSFSALTLLGGSYTFIKHAVTV